jgi:hypothetical protein
MVERTASSTSTTGFVNGMNRSGEGTPTDDARL